MNFGKPQPKTNDILDELNNYSQGRELPAELQVRRWRRDAESLRKAGSLEHYYLINTAIHGLYGDVRAIDSLYDEVLLSRPLWLELLGKFSTAYAAAGMQERVGALWEDAFPFIGGNPDLLLKSVSPLLSTLRMELLLEVLEQLTRMQVDIPEVEHLLATAREAQTIFSETGLSSDRISELFRLHDEAILECGVPRQAYRVQGNFLEADAHEETIFLDVRFSVLTDSELDVLSDAVEEAVIGADLDPMLLATVCLTYSNSQLESEEAA